MTSSREHSASSSSSNSSDSTDSEVSHQKDATSKASQANGRDATPPSPVLQQRSQTPPHLMDATAADDDQQPDADSAEPTSSVTDMTSATHADAMKTDIEEGECADDDVDVNVPIRSIISKPSESDHRRVRQDARRREEKRRQRVDRSESRECQPQRQRRPARRTPIRSRSRSRSRTGYWDQHLTRGDHDANKRSRSRSPSPPEVLANPQAIPRHQQRTVDLLTSKTGGAYIPPAKLRQLQASITDKSSAAYQRIAWEALKKSIHGYINKVNVDNIGIITRELLKENIVRGRGLICRSIIQAQAASVTFTHVYAALVAVINTKFPSIGELLLQRLVIQFKRGFRRNDKAICLSATRFVAHLVNQRVAHEILALEILTLLVEKPTDDSVEVAIAFLKESGMRLQEMSAKGVNAIFEMLKNILHEGRLDKRVQYMIEVVFQVRKDGFKDHVAVVESLDLVEEDTQITHLVMLTEPAEAQDGLNVFKFDAEYQQNETEYKELSRKLLGSDGSSDDDDDGDSASGSGSDSDDSTDDEGGAQTAAEAAKQEMIIDQTETNLVALRRTIYLTIHSSLDYEECAHKLMKMQLKPGQEMELCHMFLDCCAEQRTYEKFYGLLAQRFCTINKIYIPPFEEIFKDTYATIHRLDTNRLRNVSKFFAHLLFTDAIGWDVFECIRLNEDDTTSSSRVFIKILFQELAEYMGLGKLNGRLKDVSIQESFAGLFPRDNPRNTRFAINFFTSIGLGGLTDELREHLKNAPKLMTPIVPVATKEEEVKMIDSSSSSSSSSSSDSSSSSSSSSSDSSSDSVSSSSASDGHCRRSTKKKAKKDLKQKRLSKKSPQRRNQDEDDERARKPRNTDKLKRSERHHKVEPDRKAAEEWRRNETPDYQSLAKPAKEHQKRKCSDADSDVGERMNRRKKAIQMEKPDRSYWGREVKRHSDDEDATTRQRRKKSKRSISNERG